MTRPAFVAWFLPLSSFMSKQRKQRSTSPDAAAVNWLAAKVRIMEGRLSELSQHCIGDYANQSDPDGYDKFFMGDLPGTVDVASQTDMRADVCELPDGISTQTDISLIPDAICTPIFDPCDLLCSLQSVVLKALMDQMEDTVADIDSNLEGPLPCDAPSVHVHDIHMTHTIIPVLPDSAALIVADADRYRNEILLIAFHDQFLSFSDTAEQMFEMCVEQKDQIPLVVDDEFSEIALQECVDTMGKILEWLPGQDHNHTPNDEFFSGIDAVD